MTLLATASLLFPFVAPSLVQWPPPMDKLPHSTLVDTAPSSAPPPSTAAESPPADPPSADPPSASPALSADPPATETPSSDADPPSTTTADGSTDTKPATSAPGYPAPTVGVVASAPPPKSVPLRWRFDLSLGMAATRVGDQAFLGLSRSRSVLGASPSLRFDWRVRPGGAVFVGGGVLYRGTRRGTSLRNGAVDTELAHDEALTFVRVSLMPVEGLDIFADLGVGPSVARVGLRDTGSDIRASQRDVLVVADGAAGVSLYLPKRWLPRKQAARATGGLTASFGYTIRNALRIDPTLSQEPDAIRTVSLPLGDVSMRGLSWSVGVFVRFM